MATITAVTHVTPYSIHICFSPISYIKTMSELIFHSCAGRGDWLQYFQLRHFYDGLGREQLCGDLSMFEELCLSDQKYQQALSKIYGIPLSLAFPHRPFYTRDCEQELGSVLHLNQF